MLAPALPGFIYDEVRKKYFRITNGSSLSYHNSDLQAKRRRLEHEKQPHNRRDGHKNTSKTGLRRRLCPQSYPERLLRLHLGHVSLSPAFLARLTFKSLRLCLTIVCNNIRVWSSFKLGQNECFVVSEGRRLCIVKSDDIRSLCSGNEPSPGLPLHFHYTSEQALTEFFTGVNPLLTVELVSCSGSYCLVTYKLGQENAFSFIYGFLKWELTGPVDLSGSLIRCMESLLYEKAPLVLFLASSQAQMAVEGPNVIIQCPRRVYLLVFDGEEFAVKREYPVTGRVAPFQAFSRPPKLQNGVLLFSSGNTLHVNDGGRKPVTFTHPGPISNFFLLPSEASSIRVLVVGLQKVTIYEKLNGKVLSTAIDYLNENVRNQCSFIVENNLVINRNNGMVQVSHLFSGESEMKELGGYDKSHGSLEGVFSMERGYLAVYSNYSSFTRMSYYE